ncbi:hypothetical protein DPSP01_011047 [Paraphaeosphaeria sporulosa]|uniref:Uncharacterized protein n=1 Tax=Paraphaeosphaeria sporulosa TaxID=1460663 RepID=A0A177CNE4_9PLEO|nr:uncharacterized protein CC84DRAFT_1203699 [Paraphaeosphaeria sporulosa]OAG08277.1 hypothetical protein CC84DRAFT_1203699 [Paraphaeosphaeria sporulosa]
MSKRNSEGEVLSNKLAVGLARFQQQQFAALFGDSAPAVAESHDQKAIEQASTADLKGDGDDESFGLGAIIPKDVQDGSFTSRIPTSHERLLENLIGKKAAKAHMAAKQKHAATVKPQKPEKPTLAKDESDEEEGRAASFRSRRQRHTVPPVAKQEDSDDEDEESRALSLRSKKLKTDGQSRDLGGKVDAMANGPENELAEEKAEGIKNHTPVSRPPKAKPKSYLDEILGEKAKKKNKKKKKSKIGGEKTDD